MKLLPVAILAGGLATRLRPHTDTIPKSLIPICGEPFIFHQLRLLHARGIREVVLCVGYLAGMIKAAVGNGDQFGLTVQYVDEGPVLLGTGGALKNAAGLLGEHFFVLYGDSYLLCDYAKVQASYFQQGLSGLMTIYQNTDTAHTNNIEFANNQLIAYDKIHPSARMHYIDYGLSVLNQQALVGLAVDQPSDMSAIYQALLQQQQLGAYVVEQRFYEVGSFAGIDELAYYFSQAALLV